MGSSISHIYDDMEQEQFEKDKQWLKEQIRKIEKINPCNQEFTDLKWLFENKNKILKNKKLIEIIGT